MATRSLTKWSERVPSLFDDFFKPWNEWFDEGGNLFRVMNIPAVNITEKENQYQVALAAPGLKKDDFKIDVSGNMLTISCEKEESRDESGKKFNRKEYNYSSFSRSFTLPDEVNQDKIEARYEEGVLNITLPRREAAKKSSARQIAVK